MTLYFKTKIRLQLLYVEKKTELCKGYNLYSKASLIWTICSGFLQNQKKIGGLMFKNFANSIQYNHITFVFSFYIKYLGRFYD